MKIIDVLNNGFVELVDKMGDDYSILRAARVSTGSDVKKGETKDRGLIRYLYRNKHCYTEGTEILTDSGFKLFEGLSDDDKVATINPSDGSFIGFEKPLEYIKDDYEGEIFHFDGDIDLSVTPNHKIYFRNFNVKDSQYKLDYCITPFKSKNGLGNAQIVAESKIRMLKVATANKTNSVIDFSFGYNIDPIAFSKIIGFAIGGGSSNSKNQIGFHLKKERKVNFLKNICKKAGIELKSLKNNVYVISLENIGIWFNENCYDENRKKILPSEYFYAPHEIIENLFDGLKNSDGSIKRSTWTYSTNSKKLANQIQAIGAINNFSFSLRSNEEEFFTLNLNSRRIETVINDTRSGSKLNKISYKGKINSVRVSSGLILVRKNGKTVISGNSSPFSFVSFQFHFKMPIFVARQFMRHRTFDINEASARYKEFEWDTWYADEARVQDTENKQSSNASNDKFFTADFNADIQRFYAIAEQEYQYHLGQGVAREQARAVMPVGQYTEFYAHVNLRNLFHFLELRLHPHAQEEIRVYAEAILEILESLDDIKWSVEIFKEMNEVDLLYQNLLNDYKKDLNKLKQDLFKLKNSQKYE